MKIQKSINFLKTLKSIYLDSVLEKTGTPVICGDFNFKVNDGSDSIAQKFISLYCSKGFKQHVTGATHKDGNTLDLVLTLESKSDSVPIKYMEIDKDHVISDHYLVHFQLPLKRAQPKSTNRETKDYRELSKVDINQFRCDLKEALSN